MAKLGSLVYDLVANTANFERGLTKAEATARKRSTAIERRFKRMSTSIGIAFGGAAILTGVRKTVKSFADFEQGLVAVGKTTGISGQELENLGKSIQDISLVVPVAVTDLLAIAGAAGQVGVKGSANIAAFTNTLGMLQTATDVVGDQGAKAIARILTVTQEGFGAVGQFGNVITRLGNDAAASESEILGMATEIAQATALFGVSSSEALALGAAFQGIGQKAEKTGTVLGRTFLTISQAVGKGGEDLALIADIAGMTTDEFSKLFNTSSAQAFVAFQVGLGNMAGGANSVAAALEKLGLSGVRPIGVLGSMAKASSELERQFATMNEELEDNDALLKEMLVAAGTFTSKMTLLGNAANIAAKELGDMIAPALLVGINALRDGALALARNMDLLKDAVTLVASIFAGRFIASVIGSQTGLGIVALLTGQVTAKMYGLSLGLRAATAAGFAFNRVMAFFGGPIGLAISAVAGAYLLLSNHTDSAAEATDKYKQALEEANQAGNTAIENSNQMAAARRAESIETLKAAVAERNLAIARFQSRLDEKPRLGGQGQGTTLSLPGRIKELERVRDEAQAALQKLLDNPIVITPPVIKTPKITTAIAGAAGDDATKKVKEQKESLEQITFELQRQRDLAEARVSGYERELQIMHQLEDAALSIGRALTDPEKDALRDLIVETELLDAGMRKVAEDAKESFEQMSVYADEAARDMQDSLADFLFDPFADGLEGMLEGFVNMLRRMAAEQAAAQLFEQFNLGGLVQAGVGALLGGGGGGGSLPQVIDKGTQYIPGLAGGGTLAAGQMALVGEQGPELFVPKSAGEIIPNGQSGGGITVNVNVSGSDVAALGASATQAGFDVGRAITLATRRNG